MSESSRSYFATYSLSGIPWTIGSLITLPPVPRGGGRGALARLDSTPQRLHHVLPCHHRRQQPIRRDAGPTGLESQPVVDALQDLVDGVAGGSEVGRYRRVGLAL